MNIRTIVGLFCVGLFAWIGCSPSIPFGPTSSPLDEATAQVTIAEDIGGSEATVSASITSSAGSPLSLSGGQTVSVNGQSLLGDAGVYSRIVSAASDYTITVNEPTRGVQDTLISRPSSFEILSPRDEETASLAGFSLSWSNADSGLDATVTLTQTILGNQKTQTFGPFTDTGGQSFDADDLRDFGQGAMLLISVTKIRERRGIDGFNTATLTSELTATDSATPGP
jgi:hypothetical protein